MPRTSPRTASLRKHLINYLAQHERAPEETIKAQMRAIYSVYPADVVRSAVETLLLRLDESGILSIEAGNLIALTKRGREEHGRMAAAKTARRAANQPVQQRTKTAQEKRDESSQLHDELKRELGELARLLGREWTDEHELVKGGPVRVDFVWYTKPYGLSHAFEVQHRGDWKNAISNLEAVEKRHPACKLFLVVWEEKQLRPIRRNLEARLNTSVKVVRATQMREWISFLKEATAARQMIEAGLI